jgi:tetratricopeptide (TPR) repeat protein
MIDQKWSYELINRKVRHSLLTLFMLSPLFELSSISFYLLMLGILLRVMGRPAESLLAHEAAFNRSISNFDRSSVLQMKADSHLLMNQIDAAIQCYNQALEFTYYELKLYLPLVESYREKGVFTKDDWARMVKKMENSLADSKEEGYMTDAAKKDVENSYLYQSAINHLSFRSAIYRALFAAADKGNKTQIFLLFLDIIFIVTHFKNSLISKYFYFCFPSFSLFVSFCL